MYWISIQEHVCNNWTRKFSEELDMSTAGTLAWVKWAFRSNKHNIETAHEFTQYCFTHLPSSSLVPKSWQSATVERKRFRNVKWRLLQLHHSQEWSILNFSCNLTRNITSHSIKNLAFHSFLGWKVIMLPTLTYTFLFRKVGRLYFLNLGVKGLSVSASLRQR